MRKVLIYIGSGMLVVWGAAHILNTTGVVAGFGPISADNTRVITMEWISEGLTLIFLGALSIAAGLMEKKGAEVSGVVYIMVFIMLVVMSILSLFTGYGINFLPYKLCPYIFTTAGLLVLQGVRKR